MQNATRPLFHSLLLLFFLLIITFLIFFLQSRGSSEDFGESGRFRLHSLRRHFWGEPQEVELGGPAFIAIAASDYAG
jgi:hypothetical protein